MSGVARSALQANPTEARGCIRLMNNEYKHGLAVEIAESLGMDTDDLHDIITGINEFFADKVVLILDQPALASLFGRIMPPADLKDVAINRDSVRLIQASIDDSTPDQVAGHATTFMKGLTLENPPNEGAN